MRYLDRRWRSALQRSLRAARDSLHRRWVRVRLNHRYPLQEHEESLGQYGERLAGIYLERCGYQLLEQSFHARTGEIDWVAAWRREMIVFVEVKTWAAEWVNAGGPADAVDENKQRKLTQTALIYMKRHGLLESRGRMDVIAVTFDPATRSPRFRHFENAFEAVGTYQMFS